MINPKLTILSSSDSLLIRSKVKFVYRTYFQRHKGITREYIDDLKLGGHRALRENLIHGLQKGKIEFELANRIPNYQSDIGLLAGKGLLRNLTRFQGFKQEKIVVGPNLFVTPRGFEFELQQKSVRKIVVPSDWVVDLFAQELPEIAKKIVVWPVGIDFDYWDPSALKENKTKDSVLIYLKHENIALVDEVKSAIEKYGLLSHVVTYGSYEEDYYRKKLNDCVALVYIGKSESQGIALLEAWAMNVPTFVYKANNPISITSEHGTLILGPDQYSAAPYLTDERGLFWSNVSELGSYLKDINHFSPRNKSGMFSAKNCAIEYKNLFND